jgi:hypothetical protein
MQTASKNYPLKQFFAVFAFRRIFHRSTMLKVRAGISASTGSPSIISFISTAGHLTNSGSICANAGMTFPIMMFSFF